LLSRGADKLRNMFWGASKKQEMYFTDKNISW
jgi:hypothetical protein